ncbi:unnamed protein product [Nesidiocoris tenuis]|uniref:Uncharacterized protein n=1 Tax=Nesidiocoris tenuis TaxID=355587 RepID=A0A6H5G2E3_9HEMI|nr:unnamed protein product [Nesidiocoris tenuis]
MNSWASFLVSPHIRSKNPKMSISQRFYRSNLSNSQYRNRYKWMGTDPDSEAEGGVCLREEVPVSNPAGDLLDCNHAH